MLHYLFAGLLVISLSRCFIIKKYKFDVSKESPLNRNDSNIESDRITEAKGFQLPQITVDESETGLDRGCVSSKQKQSKSKYCENKFPKNYLDDNQKDLMRWMDVCIVEYFCFEQVTGKTEWEKQPTLEGLLDDPVFLLAAKFAEHFFMVNSDWEITVDKWKTEEGGKYLLFITGARYIYVTSLLFQESRPQDEKGNYQKGGKGRLIPCETVVRETVKVGGKDIDIILYKIPEYSCYPPPYGSATPTSDYDVGLVGPKSGELLANFNGKFEGIFKKSSEEVFDTNIYAYTLEYVIPSKFIGLPASFKKELEKMETDVKYQAQDLISALFKVKKYKSNNYEELYKDLQEISNKEAKDEINSWNDMVLRFEMLTASLDPDKLTRQESNSVYQELMKAISDRTEKDKFYVDYIEEVMLGLLYAAEAYHSRGATRYVVGVLQMHDPQIKSGLTLLDLWCSILENWGDAMKEFKRAKEAKMPAAKTLVKMSKYLFRTWLSMKEIRNMEKLSGLVDTAELESQSSIFNNIKKERKTATSDQVQAFYAAAKCKKDDSAQAGKSLLTDDCIAKMFEIVKEYHRKLMQKIFDDNKR